MTANHQKYMRECLELAKKGEGLVSPNPLVGALLVRNGKIIGRGFHRRYGEAHAEVDCIRHARGPVAGATLYVNLEPCSHHGKTPPCAEMIIQAGIRDVVVATKDPNPLVGGRGIRRLRAAGVAVRVGVLEDEARYLNRSFFLHITRRRPYVHLKIAQTLDGMIASRSGKPRWISSKESRRMVHLWRGVYDAVLVGAGTVIADDPKLTVRYHRGRHPAAIILDGGLNTPVSASLFKADRPVYLVTSKQSVRVRHSRAESLERKGATLVVVSGRPSALNLKRVLNLLYRYGVGSILVEGGQAVFTQFLCRGPVDELSIFLAPTVLGAGIPAVTRPRGRQATMRFSRWSAMPVGQDILIQAFR